MSPTSYSDNSTAAIETCRTLKLNGHVGFDSLPDQLVNKSVHQGFDFNILCIGETGLGKSTLLNTLFNTNFNSTPSTHSCNNVKLKANTYALHESNVRLNLTICETIGYGDQINKTNSFNAVVDYIDAQFEAYLQEELKINRELTKYHDSRVHACLYFIAPTGHGLKSLDLVYMRRLEAKVNMIPIIAKADTITKTELQDFKLRIINELAKYKVALYKYPTDDETVSEMNAVMNTHTPFAVIGSTDFFRFAGKNVRARQYPWGVVQVENELHCDFVKLREMLIRINMEDLRESTHEQHYELYRQKRLQQMGFNDVDANNKPMTFQQIYELKRSKHLTTLHDREEHVREIFVQRVKAKETELKQKERDLHVKFEQLRSELNEETSKLFKFRKLFEEERHEFQLCKHEFEKYAATLTLGRLKKK